MSEYRFLEQQESIGKKGFSPFVMGFILAIFLIAALLPQPGYAKSNPRYGAIVMDADTGMILYQDRANKKLHPASLTKMMTLLLTFDALKKGRIGLNDRVEISKRAAGAAPSKLGLEPGSTIRVEDAIYALVTKSANDIAVALAEHLGRTEDNFARMMTRKAYTLGMTGTHFRNASGLHDPRQVSTAHDMAQLARTLIRDYPEYYRYFSTRTFTYQGRSYNNHNRLMNTYPGMDGLKTGYIQASGFNLAATAVQDGHRLIGVVFGGRTSHSRNHHMAQILDQGFAKMRRNDPPVLIAKSLPPKTIPIPTAKPDMQTTVLASLEQPASPKSSEGRQSTGSVRGQNIASYSDESDADDDESPSRWASLDDPSKNSMFRRMIGEGDYDIAVRRRIETGLIAISAIKDQGIPQQRATLTEKPTETASVQPVSYHQQSSLPQDWSIQIGAYTSRDATNKALASSLASLPMDLRHAYATVAPVKTEQGWIFRGRLKGYSKDNARKACAILKDCIALSPQTAP